MIRLLRAGFSRMFKNKYFWFCALATFFVSGVLTYIILMLGSAPITWEGMIFGFSGVSLFTSAAFVVLFLGEEYSDNTIRNKLIIGRTRTQIYFANLVTVVIGGLCMLMAEKLVPLAAALLGGAGALTMGVENFTLGIVICVCAVVASCILFAAIGTVVTKKSAAVTLALTLTIGAYAVTPIIRNKLNKPQIVTITEYDENENFVKEREEANPEAAAGGLRVVLKNIYNTLSFGQLEQAARDTDARTLLPLYSLGSIAVVAAAGGLIFRRKDIK